MIRARFTLVVAALATGILPTLLAAQTAPATTATRPRPPAASRPAPASRPVSELEKTALADYDKLVAAYMKGDWETINETLKTFANRYAETNTLPLDKRQNIEWIRKAVAEERPKWWEKTKSDSNTSFQSTIWGRNVTTNYVPDDQLGVQAPVDIQDGKLVTVVAWRPTQVDNPRPAEGTVSKRLGLTQGDIGEVVVWHELGHNFISSALTADQAIDLYRNHSQIYGTLQEFFADMTALAHCSARARPITMILRLDSIDPPPPRKYRELEPHTRGAHGIGAMFLNEVLSDPAAWPHVHLPPAVPAENVELATITYMYENWSTEWSFAEEKQLRDWAQKMVRTNGDAIFRSKGKIPLKDNLTFSLMEAQDREFQAKRDAWIKEKLRKAIDGGHADQATAPRPKLMLPGTRLEVPNY